MAPGFRTPSPQRRLEEADLSSSSQPLRSRLPRGGPVRGLVVADAAEMAGLLKRGLEEGGYAVDTAGDGREALWLATENPYDAIVLDVMLPDLDGFEVCRRLRDAGRWS